MCCLNKEIVFAPGLVAEGSQEEKSGKQRHDAVGSVGLIVDGA